MALTGIHFHALQHQDAMLIPIAPQIQTGSKFAVLREHKAIKPVT